MNKVWIYILRISIVVLLLLPVFVPYIEQNKMTDRREKVQILLPDGEALPFQVRESLKHKISDTFLNAFDLTFEHYGNKEADPITNYEDLLDKVTKSKGVVVVLSQAQLFGKAAQKFNAQLLKTRAFEEQRLYFFDPNQDTALQQWHNATEKTEISNQRSDEYLVLSDLFIPEFSFVGEENFANLSLIGQAKPNSTIQLEVVLYVQKGFLSSKKFQINVPSSGLVKEVLDIPVRFIKTGVHSITAIVKSDISQSPLNTASAFTQVLFSKTTILHIAVGPDWNLRQFRQKLKFWPNLDLLSFYILRDFTSDQSIPNSQMSLIEFPQEKLFGEGLAHLHGIVAQNFLFDSFLGPNELSHLNEYVKDGGRMVIAAGPLSFKSSNPNMSELFPCENTPQWEIQNNYHWVTNKSNITTGSQEFEHSLNNITSHETFVGCVPKKNALVLANTVEGNNPVLIAMPYGKGMVLSILGGDWLTSSIKNLDFKPLRADVQDKPRMENSYLSLKYANSSEVLSRWVVEFLQRRQDAGLRVPLWLAPRIYAQDKILPALEKEVLPTDFAIAMTGNQGTEIVATPKNYSNLDLRVLELASPLENIIKVPTPKSNHVEFQWEDVQLNLKADNNQNSNLKKTVLWPIFPYSAKKLETLRNPFLFEGIKPLSHRIDEKSSFKTGSIQKKPLLECYPWLMALALLLLACEQAWVHFFKKEA